jgi:hypothetical protein
MKIIQFSTGIDNETFQPMGLFTIEIPLTAMQDAVASMSNDELEQFVGKKFLTAFDTFKKERDAVTDVEVKEDPKEETNVNSESTPVPQES